MNNKSILEQANELAGVWEIIKNKNFVDLTQTFEPGIPHSDLFPNEEVKIIYNHKENGFLSQVFTHVGQWGTHIDAPSHFMEGGRSVDDIGVKDMVMPLVILDVHEKVVLDPDYLVSMDDVNAWEAKYGKITQGSFVALRTDWSKRWAGGMDAMVNKGIDNVFHYPGWSKDVIEYLSEDCKVTAIGHETTDTDPGISCTNNEYVLEDYILKRNHYQIEMLTNLDLVPEYGALVVVTCPKAKGASGFPARVFAILP